VGAECYAPAHRAVKIRQLGSVQPRRFISMTRLSGGKARPAAARGVHGSVPNAARRAVMYIGGGIIGLILLILIILLLTGNL
jgi:hypothetical protein